MRIDSIGLFWEDLEVSRKKGERRAAIMPPIPDTGWKRPTTFPDLSTAPCISLDCETWDPELEDFGPGWARGKGHIVGVSIGVPGGYKWYFPMRHEIEPEDNMNPEDVLAWLRVTLSNPNQPKIGANLPYDLGWLQQEGVEVKGMLIDVQYAEALLDESSEVALEVLAQKYLGEGKDSNLLYQWCADYYGGNPTGKQRANIYRTPPRLTGPYAESDADLPLRVAAIQYGLLCQEGLYDLFKMECEMIRLIVAMRFEGVTVDLDKAQQVRERLQIEEVQLQLRLDEMVGFQCNVNAAEHLQRAFDSFGLQYPKTAKGNPSFTKDFLKVVEHPVGILINEIRSVAKLRGTFVESYILDSHINGKVYCQFHQLRGDGGGTRSGRFSSSTPNLQNIPSRDPVLAPLIRGMFVPDLGHACWRKYDYSQIEYRFLAHYAVGEGAVELRKKFNDNPDVDYHDVTRDMIKAVTGILLERKPTKTINFGLIYGMGEPKLARSIGVSQKEGRELFKAYHKGAPFAKATMDSIAAEAEMSGIVTTILGRKSRFDLYEDGSRGGFDPDAPRIALPYHKAIMQWSKIKRAFTHKALNRRLQGSAADMMKLAMYECHQQGIFDATGIPRLTVHDELDFSMRDKSKATIAAYKEMQHVMENCMQLNVPIRADGDEGPDWGDLEAIKE